MLSKKIFQKLKILAEPPLPPWFSHNNFFLSIYQIKKCSEMLNPTPPNHLNFFKILFPEAEVEVKYEVKAEAWITRRLDLLSIHANFDLSSKNGQLIVALIKLTYWIGQGLPSQNIWTVILYIIIMYVLYWINIFPLSTKVLIYY